MYDMLLCFVFVCSVVCFDAKINFDDNAKFRQQEIFALDNTSESDPREVDAASHNLSYIGMDGNIGCLGWYHQMLYMSQFMRNQLLYCNDVHTMRPMRWCFVEVEILLLGGGNKVTDTVFCTVRLGKLFHLTYSEWCWPGYGHHGHCQVARRWASQLLGLWRWCDRGTGLWGIQDSHIWLTGQHSHCEAHNPRNIGTPYTLEAGLTSASNPGTPLDACIC